jgi:hypothetical protein
MKKAEKKEKRTANMQTASTKKMHENVGKEMMHGQKDRRIMWSLILFVVIVVCILVLTRMKEGLRNPQAVVVVEEMEKGRTHHFNLAIEGNRVLLDGFFSIAGKDYPGRIYYDGEKSYIMRKNPDQCIVYDTPGKNFFGFVPVFAKDVVPDVNNDQMTNNDQGLNVTLVENDTAGNILTYRVESDEGSSIIEVHHFNTAQGNISSTFSLPEDCIKEEEAVNIEA